MSTSTGVCARPLDCADRWHGGVRDGDHLVARTDPDGAQREFDRVRPVGDSDRVRDAVIGGELGFEGAHLGAEDVPAAVQHPQRCRVDLALQLSIRTQQIVERYHRFPKSGSFLA